MTGPGLRDDNAEIETTRCAAKQRITARAKSRQDAGATKTECDDAARRRARLPAGKAESGATKGEVAKTNCNWRGLNVEFTREFAGKHGDECHGYFCD